MLNVPKRANDAMHMSMLDGYDVTKPFVLSLSDVFCILYIYIYIYLYSPTLVTKQQRKHKYSTDTIAANSMSSHHQSLTLFYDTVGATVAEFILL